jgi:hypothetical protein
LNKICINCSFLRQIKEIIQELWFSKSYNRSIVHEIYYYVRHSDVLFGNSDWLFNLLDKENNHGQKEDNRVNELLSVYQHDVPAMIVK